MKHAIVTGGGHGLGQEIATTLDQNGYRVGVVDINKEQAETTVKSLNNGVALVANVADEGSVEEAFSKFGENPDLLVNGAGIVRFGPLNEQSVEDYRQVIDVNLMGPCICSRIAAKAMIAKGSGHIINITSVNGIHPAPNVGLYAATKAALGSLTQLMSIELGPKGIRVNAIAPGFIDAGMSKPIYENPRVREVRSSGVPLRKLGEADDIARAVLFLDSENAGYINGHELVIDGGVVNSIFAALPRE